FLIAFPCVASLMAASAAVPQQDLDGQVQAALRSAGFTGTIQSQFLPMLGRPVNPQLADLGRLLWFDNSGGLHDDNTCGGCHSPSRAFGDTQSIAIGDRKSTRLNSSHSQISYAVFCLKKKK